MMSEDDLLAGASDDLLMSEADVKALLDGKDDDPLDEPSAEDDLYDAAIEPSSVSAKRESADTWNATSTAAEAPKPTAPTTAAASTTSKAPTPVTTQMPPLPTPLMSTIISTQTPPHAQSSTTSVSSVGSGSSRRHLCYIGNMAWWTTDKDIKSLLAAIGVSDAVDVRFAENRQNGQSRGFATIVGMLEASLNLVLDRVPGRQLHGNTLTAFPYTKQSLARLEEANKSSSGEKKEDKTIPNLGTVRLGPQAPMGLNFMNRPQMGALNGLGGLGMAFGGAGASLNPMTTPSLMTLRTGMTPLMQTPVPMVAPPLSLGTMSRPPPSFGVSVAPPPAAQLHSNANAAQAMNSLLRGAQLTPPISSSSSNAQPLIPPGTHVNPQMYPYLAQGPKNDVPRGGEVSSAEFEEIMNRNRTVFNSAVQRAMGDASDGNTSAAIETLQTAMGLIRQSRVGGTDACRSLLSTLQDTYNGIESKHERGSGRKHRRRSRSPSDRGSRKYRRRSSRSRSRDRYDTSARQSRRF